MLISWDHFIIKDYFFSMLIGQFILLLLLFAGVKPYYIKLCRSDTEIVHLLISVFQGRCMAGLIQKSYILTSLCFRAGVWQV